MILLVDSKLLGAMPYESARFVIFSQKDTNIRKVFNRHIINRAEGGKSQSTALTKLHVVQWLE